MAEPPERADPAGSHSTPVPGDTGSQTGSSPPAGSPQPAELRVSDAERESVAEQLRCACAEGRLDADELDQRVESAYRAKVGSELDALLIDLPGAGRRRPAPNDPPDSPAAPQSPLPAPRRRLRMAFASYVGVNAWMVGIWAATSGIHGYFWPFWTLLPGGIGLLTAWIRGGDPPEHLARRAERHERRRLERERRHAGRRGLPR